MDKLEISPDSEVAEGCLPGCDDYLRLALRPTQDLLVGRKRLPRGFWPTLEEIMGNKRQHLERKLQILKLPDTVLPLVESHQLTERQLREIIAMPEDFWERVIHDTIEHQLTGPELAFVGRGDIYDVSLQTILDRRLDQIETNAATPKTGQKPSAQEPAPEQLIQKKVLSLAKFLGRTSKSLGDDWPFDAVVDNMMFTGEYQVVLDNVDKFEELIRRLKSRATEAGDDGSAK